MPTPRRSSVSRRPPALCRPPLRSTWLALALLALLAGCGPAADQPTRLAITGSSTVAPLVTEIASRFEELHPQVRVDVQTGGSSRGMADVRQGLAEIGMVSRSPKAAEDDLAWHPVALDGLALIVHGENPVGALDSAQVRAIYRGEIENWSRVGGVEAPITVVGKAEGRSTLEVFLGHFELAPSEVKASVIIGDNQQGIKTVAGDPHAIGYVSIGAAELEVRNGSPLALLALDGEVPSTEAVRAGTYSLGRTLHLVTAGEPEGWAETFVEYSRSPAVADLVEGQFFVPLGR